MPKEQKTEREKFKVLYFYPGDYVSVSSLQSFESCPLSFYLRYYCGVEFPPNEKMILGSVFQEALNAKYAGKDYNEIINKIPKKDRKTATELIGRANEFNNILSIDDPYVADVGIGIPIKFIPDLYIEGSIIENKYTSGYYNEESIKKQKQGTVYYYGIKRLFGKEVKVIYQLFNNKDKTVKLVEVKKNGIDVADLITWMISTLGRIKQCYISKNFIINQHSKFECDLGKACLIKRTF